MSMARLACARFVRASADFLLLAIRAAAPSLPLHTVVSGQLQRCLDFSLIVPTYLRFFTNCGSQYRRQSRSMPTGLLLSARLHNDGSIPFAS